jgi:TatD DNase family protein
MLIDTHAHLDFEQFHRQHDEIIKKAHKAGVHRIVNVGTNLQGTRDSVSLANKYLEVYAACGIHPHDVGQADRKTIAEILRLASDKKVVAIGEIGLDYSRKNIDEANQKKAFIVQISLAKRLGLPIIVHNREADLDILEILKQQGTGVSGVIHCFSSSWQLAKKFLELGFYISFTGSITFVGKKTKTSAVLEVVKKVPLDKVMVETDCPFLAPEPYRGKVNEPAYVVEVAKKIAKVKGLFLDKVALATTQNAERLFRFANH